MINRRVLAIILAITMATSASVSSGFDVFASEVPAAQEELTETEENIIEAVGEILDKKDAAEEIVTEGDAGKIAEENTEEKVIEIVTDEAAGDTANDSVEEGTTITVGTDEDNKAEQETVVKIITEEEDEEASPSEIKKASSSDADIELTAKAEDGTVVTVKASADEFPYDSLSLVAHVVEGEKAEEASEEIEEKEPEENTAKRVTYDIQVQNNGVEVQPVFGKNVKVSFSVPDIPSGADEVIVYHHEDDKVEEIATIELKEDATSDSDSEETFTSVDETSVVIDDTYDEKTSAAASSDIEDNYADIELENDLTIEGDTTSFSYYTVDFTYNDKQVSISGDSNHNKLSEVLAAIDITDAITDAKAYLDEECTQPAANNTVTVDGKDLFKVYEENGTWYVDAINAFSSTHGLLVKAGEGEYKVRVTDQQVVFIVEKDDRVTITYNDSEILTETKYIYAYTWCSCTSYTPRQDAYFEYRKEEGASRTEDKIHYEPKEGYKWVCVQTYDGADIGYPGVHVYRATVENTRIDVNFTHSGGGSVNWKNGTEVGTISQILPGKTITTYGSYLKIDGENVIVASPSDGYVFVRWEGVPDSKRLDENTTIKAVFKEEPSYTITPFWKEYPNFTWGAVYPTQTVKVPQDAEINGSASSSEIIIKKEGHGEQKLTAVSNDTHYFDGWVWYDGDTALSEWPTEVDKDMRLLASFVEASDANSGTIKLASATNGSYEKSFMENKLKVKKGSRVQVSGQRIQVGMNVESAYIEAIPNRECTFVLWYYKYPAEGVNDWTAVKDGALPFMLDGELELMAEFKKNDTKTEDNPDPDTPTYSGGSGGSGSTETDPLDTTNYHAENTYGSWENPIDDGEWEYVANDTWKYNSSTPMKNCWACIVNPYANVDKGQHAHDWFFFDPYGHMMTGWRMIDGKWYYFEPISNGCRGGLYMSTTTPDGYQVDANGAWIQ